MESLGLNVSIESDSLKAIDCIKKRHEENNDYDVLIVDYKMPNVDGIEMIRRIRKDLGIEIPILLISAYDWTEIEKKAIDAGATGFINKPLFPSTIYDKLIELLGKEKNDIEPENDYSDLAGLNVLIAEDYDINWEIIKALLEMYGINSVRALNGRDCLNKIIESKENEYDLIFMDIQMPEMNGLDATKAIRKLDNHWAKSIPIVALTSDAFSENVTECLNAGMNGHIAKPVDIKLLIKEIRRIREEKKR